jgi:c-di-GMP-binding flagellar brake protein YcgR
MANTTGRTTMTEGPRATLTTSPRQSSTITDPEAVARLLAEACGRGALLFFAEVGANLAFIARGAGVDAQRRSFRIAVISARDPGAPVPVGRAFEVFAPVRGADLVFEAAATESVSGQENAYDVALPATMRLWRRREHPRGPCYGLVEVLLRRKGGPPGEGLRAALHDISNAGLGIRLPRGVDLEARAGDVLDDCVLLLNDKPMSVCALEVLHTRHDPEPDGLIAGGRFLDLDEGTAARITKLIEALDPLWDEPPCSAAD